MASSGFNDTKHLDIIAYLTDHEYTRAYDQIEPKDPPKLERIDAAGSAWYRMGYQADGIANDLKRAVDRLFSDNGGWKGPAAEAFEEKAREVYKFIARFAHVCDSTFDAPADNGDEDSGGDGEEEPDTGGFGDGSTEGGTTKKSVSQALLDAWGAVFSAQNDIEPPKWWDKPMGVRGGGRDDYTWYDIAIRKEGTETEDLPRFKYPNGIYTGTEGPEDGPIGEVLGVKKEVFEGWYDDANINTESEHNTDDHRFPKDNNEHQKLFLYLKLNKDEEENTREAANGLVRAYDDIGFKAAPKAPKIGTEDPGDNGGFSGGTGPGGPGGTTMPDPDDPTMPDPDDPTMPDPDDPTMPDPDDPTTPDPDDPTMPDPDDPTMPDPDEDDKWPPDNDDDWPPRDDPRMPDPDDPRMPDPNDPGEYDPDDTHMPPGGGGWNPDGGTTAGGIPDTDADLSRTGGGSGPISGGPFGGGGGTSAPGGSGPGAVSGANPAGGGGTGGTGAGAGLAGLGAGAGRGGMGGMMAPMMGGGGQQGQGEEETRNTWLEEEEDVWGADEDGAPPVIGGSF